MSAASAGMVALGVPAGRRAHALGVLSELLDRADAKGRVKFDDAMFAIEQRLGVDECLDAYTWLEKAGVAKRTPNGWVIRNIAAHRGPAGATAASMAVLARHLEENSAECGVERDGSDVVAEPARSRGAAELAEITPIGAARAKPVPAVSFSRRMPALAGSIAAAAALLVGLLSFTANDKVTDQRGDLASRSGALPSVEPKVAQPAATIGAVAGSVPSVVTGVTEPGSVATTPGTPAPTGLACLLPQIQVASLDFASVPSLLGGSTWTALVAGTVTNVSQDPATLDGVKVVLDLGNGVITEGTTVLSVSELAPGATGTFSGLIAAGSAKPENPSATVTATNWKSTGC